MGVKYLEDSYPPVLSPAEVNRTVAAGVTYTASGLQAAKEGAKSDHDITVDTLVRPVRSNIARIGVCLFVYVCVSARMLMCVRACACASMRGFGCVCVQHRVSLARRRRAQGAITTSLWTPSCAPLGVTSPG